MTTREARGVSAVETEEETIAAYLQHNPDFFERHHAVLARSASSASCARWLDHFAR